jgi:mannose-6-phosphate isomerase-like protein (cupin superfamily)
MINLVHSLLFAAALVQAQAATPAPQSTGATVNSEVLFWPHGVSPLGIDHKDTFANHGLQISHREKSGNVEVHLTKTDVMVIQEGTATLLYGGEGVGMHPTAPNELQGTTIVGGQSRRVSPGDVIHIPTGVPHQFILAPGEKITYLVVKVVDPPPTTK